MHYNLIEIAAGAEINGKLIHEAEAAPAKKRRTEEPVQEKAVEVDVDLDLEGVAEQNS